MKASKVLLTCMFVFLCLTKTTSAQVIDTFFVAGDLDKFYPVTFADGARGYNIATQLELGRSNVHQDSSYRGSLIAKFAFHTYNWGHGSNFIDADIRENNSVGLPNRFIAGWTDASMANSSSRIIIWLRGKTTYFCRSNYPVTPAIYDGVANALPFQQTNGPAHTYKTIIDSYVNVYGMSYGNTAYFNGTANNYFAGKVGIGVTNPTYVLHSAAYDNSGAASSLLWGEHYGAAVGVSDDTSSYYAFHVVANVDSLGRGKAAGAKSLLYVRADGNIGIGTTAPQAKLAVKGEIFGTRVKVTQTGWADFVFQPDYKLPSLNEVEDYIKNNQHLPEIPSATEVEKEGLDLGEMNRKLLQKVEELTLYLIDQQKQLKSQQEQITLLQEQNKLHNK